MLTVDFKLLKIRDGDNVLDAGCGTGRHTLHACKLAKCRICSVDILKDDVKKTKILTKYMDQTGEAIGWGEAMTSDGLRLPFQDACFDKIICSEVLEHVDDEVAGMKELVRVLKEKGCIAVTVPTYLSEAINWKIDSDYYNHPGGHVRIFKAKQLASLMRSAGLKLYAVRFEHALHTIYWTLRCLFGLKNEKAKVPALFYKMLELQIMNNSKIPNAIEGLGNFFIPKSIVMYARKVTD
ncbi:MAG: class I SAM-dependent methyltransferase [Chloroflexi bacterium]|nr:class I SAM-dependent methyltransferase [Chloroflexota bacterium]MBT7081474.1 class I SAM-dependent methyltransferase [Chloroflexota bacterium]MBT7289755.1 class I SAM-dependent methyltransferase [Chloroflexota bacterium]